MTSYRHSGHLLCVLVFLTALAILAAGARRAAAQSESDRVRTTHGTETGAVVDMSPLEVSIAKGSVGPKAVAVNEIRSIVFDGEPSELTQARVNASNGGYAAALESLDRIDVSSIERDFVRQEVEYYKALCAAQLALGGRGEIVEAGGQLNRFVRSHPQNYHYLAAVEAMGDLLMASGKYSAAQRQYAELAKAPWADYRMRSAALVARTLQEQGKHAEAIEKFDAVIEMPDGDEDVRREKLAAQLGKAVSVAAQGDTDQAVALIEQVIANVDPEERELFARAYNALGRCYRQAGQTKDALLAFLHVEVLCSTVPDAYAEALSNLVPLWEAVGQADQARQARQTLQERFAGSRWAQ